VTQDRSTSHTTKANGHRRSLSTFTISIATGAIFCYPMDMEKIFTIFDAYPNVLVGFSSKTDGDTKIKPGVDAIQDVIIKENRVRFLDSLDIKSEQVVSPILAHGNQIAIVSASDAGKTIRDVDGLIANQPGIFLTITVADCLPIYVYDVNKKIIGLAHAGWRGLKSEIIENMIEKFQIWFGSSPSDLLAGVGPFICKNHFEVKEEVLNQFLDYPDAIIKQDDKTFLDLGLIAHTKLMKLGLQESNIEISPACTFELPDKYFSFRRDKPPVAETMMAVIGMKS
jgi:YfiH family protein